MTIYELLANTKYSAEDAVTFDVLINDFKALGAYLRQSTSPEALLPFLKYLAETGCRPYLLPRVVGRFNKLNGLKIYEEVSQYIIDSRARRREASKNSGD